MPTFLVGCGKAKLPGTHRAADLYVGSLFRLARQYAERSGLWYILSAKYGLLHPDKIVECYDATMPTKTEHEATLWALWDVCHPLGHPLPELVVLAGEDYCAPLRRHLKFVEPLKGLRLGERMAWLKRNMPPLPTQGKQTTFL